MIFACIVGLTLLTNGAKALTTAFILERVAFSRQLWTKLSDVGVILAMVILLVSWCMCLWQCSPSERSRCRFTRGLRGKTAEPGSNAGHREEEGGQSESRSPWRRRLFAKSPASFYSRGNGAG